MREIERERVRESLAQRIITSSFAACRLRVSKADPTFEASWRAGAGEEYNGNAANCVGIVPPRLGPGGCRALTQRSSSVHKNEDQAFGFVVDRGSDPSPGGIDKTVDFSES